MAVASAHCILSVSLTERAPWAGSEAVWVSAEGVQDATEYAETVLHVGQVREFVGGMVGFVAAEARDLYVEAVLLQELHVRQAAGQRERA